MHYNMFQKTSFKNTSSGPFTLNANQAKVSNNSLDKVLKEVSQVLKSEKLSEKLFENYTTEEWEEYEGLNKNIKDLNKKIDHEV